MAGQIYHSQFIAPATTPWEILDSIYGRHQRTNTNLTTVVAGTQPTVFSSYPSETPMITGLQGMTFWPPWRMGRRFLREAIPLLQARQRSPRHP